MDIHCVVRLVDAACLTERRDSTRLSPNACCSPSKRWPWTDGSRLEPHSATLAQSRIRSSSISTFAFTRCPERLNSLEPMLAVVDWDTGACTGSFRRRTGCTRELYRLIQALTTDKAYYAGSHEFGLTRACIVSGSLEFAYTLKSRVGLSRSEIEWAEPPGSQPWEHCRPARAGHLPNAAKGGGPPTETEHAVPLSRHAGALG